STIALTNESAVTAARSAYNALTSTQKGYVTNLSVLTAAETKIADLKAAKTVQDKIAALPSTIALTNESAVTAARSAYNALTSTQKGYVTNLSVLTAAETKIADLKAAKSVHDKIAALPTTITLSHKSSVTAARSAYNALTSTQKGYVTNLSVLTAAESAIAKLEQTEADKAAAATVQSQIAALNVQSLSDQSAVTAARSAYNALTSAQKAYVTNLSVLTAAETKIADLQAAKTVQDKIAALPSTITLNNESAVTAARSAYNALTSTQKGYVTNLSMLTAAEAKIAELKAQAEQEAANKAAAKAVDDRIAALPDSNLDASYQAEIDAINQAIAELPEQAFDLLENLAVFSLKANAVHLATLLAAYPNNPDDADLTADQWEQLQSELENSSLKGDAVALLTGELQAKFNAYVSFDYTAPVVVYGDVDGDGIIAAADSLEVLKAVVGNVTLTEEQTIAADVDGDNRISSTDALYILKKAVGKIDKFPVEA
ncbi:MAG: hypothetical protein IKU10_02485, partial [Clostridia bacterium]|nr:hypothetical protein [Clostridia bacterium]